MKKICFFLVAVLVCFVSCNGSLDEEKSAKTIILNVSTSNSSSRSVDASYWQESDCTKYGVSVIKTESGEVVNSGEFVKNESITFTLLDEGEYTIEVSAYNNENFIIAGGSKNKSFSYGDVSNIVINIVPYQKGFDITLNDGIEVVWVDPNSHGDAYNEITSGVISDGDYSVGKILYDSNNNPVAVVAGQGTDGNWFALGIKRSDSMLWLNQNDSDETYYEAVASHVNEDGSYTGDSDGSDNWGIVSSLDSERASKGLFLAFEWANNYGSAYSAKISGWYLPSLVEYYIMWKNQTEIDSVLNQIGGDELAGYKYWSSSQDSNRTHYDAGDFNFERMEYFDSDTSGWKTCEHNYCRAIVKLVSAPAAK